MAEARRRDAWDRASETLSLLYNAHRDPQKHEATTADDWHPFRRGTKPRDEALPADITVLKVFLPSAERVLGA